MIYVLIKDGLLNRYPYFPENLRAENPGTSFPQVMPDELLREWGVFPLKEVAPPQFDSDTVVYLVDPELVGDTWTQQWRTRPMTEAEKNRPQGEDL